MLLSLRQPHRMIDFAEAGESPIFTQTHSLSYGGIHITRGALSPNPGARIGARQLVVVVHEGDAFEMEWREPTTGRIQQAMIRPGSVHVNPGDHPFYQRWEGHPRIMAIAFDAELAEQVGSSFGGKTGADIGTFVGARDAEVEAIAARLRRELVTADSAGRVLSESLAKALLVRLFRIYSRDRSSNAPVKGGLEAAKLSRVLDYIDEHLSEKITLDALADVAELSSHHFSGAFKAMTGLPPIKFVNRRRLERARDALATTDRTISDIAHGLGFPSHSHLSTYFKRDMGTPPSQFRSDWRHGSAVRVSHPRRSA